jgi:uncharacterized repeat protein (TIGR03803 family)
VIATLLAGCSGSQPTVVTPAITQIASVAANGYTSLYSFQGGTDGAFPQAGLIAGAGTLYGTTSEGGSEANDGTIFALNASGVENVVYRFKGYPTDGESPMADLTAAKTIKYGTTFNGGSGPCPPSVNGPGCGTVFALSASGAETVLYSFGGHPNDGENPAAGVTAVNGALYGTTLVGGTGECTVISSVPVGCGTVFEIGSSGKERVLHAFKGGRDGESPSAGLTARNGMLFGTASFGGNRPRACEGSGGLGCGVVFELRAMKERVLYRFKGDPDGAHPFASLLALDGMLYGTTAGGGSRGAGTVFEITASGKERVLYTFKGGSDGAGPSASLTGIGGMLYGTTAVGGSSSCGGYGCGTVFEVSMSGKERVLHRFEGGADGQSPHTLLDVNGVLYGTTSQGGKNGDGTIFSIK